MSKPGEAYERLAMRVFRALLDMPGAEVIHDTTVAGRTGAHQIDVIGKFERNGIQFTVLIQAKDWKKPVDQGEVLKFHDILEDVPGQPRGLMFSRSGFQSGAKDVAKGYGIALYELREARAGEAPSGEVVFEITAYCRKIGTTTPILDEAWFRQEAQRIGLARGTRLELRGTLRKFRLLDDQGQERCTLLDTVASMFPTSPSHLDKTMREVRFSKPMFAKAGTSFPIPLIPVLGVRAEIWTERVELKATLVFEAAAAWLLRQVNEGIQMALDPKYRRIDIPKEQRVRGIQWMLEPSYLPWSGRDQSGSTRTPNGWNALCLLCPPGSQRKTMGLPERAAAYAEAAECLELGHRVYLERYWEDEQGIQHVDQESIGGDTDLP